MGKSLQELKADAEAADRAYREAVAGGEENLSAIAAKQDEGIRPKFEREVPRDEHGNPVPVDKYGNPQWRKGHKISAAHARPVYEPPLRSRYSEPDAEAPDIDFKTNGTWDEAKDLWLDLIDVLTQLDEGKLTSEERESCTQILVPSLLDRLAATAPRVDCAFTDGPMGKGAWLALVDKYRTAFNPSKSLERSIGTMRTRTAPKFVTFAYEGAKWLFRKCPTGIPQIPKPQPAKPEPIAAAPIQPKRRGRPKKEQKENVSNLE